MYWKNNSNTSIVVEQWGAWNEPNVELPEGLLYMVARLLKKAKGYTLHGFLYWRRTSNE